MLKSAGRRVFKPSINPSIRCVVLASGSGSGRFAFADSSSYFDVAGALPSALWSPEGPAVPASLARTPIYPLVA